MRWFGGCFLLLALSLAGCRSKVVTTVEEVAPEDTTTHLGDKIDISLADWLKLPRPELAKLVEEWTVTVHKQQESARSNPDSVQLLPQLHPPTVGIVFADAHFSPAAGFSLPPYLKEGQKDAAVALHLARFGDREAALKMANEDKELLAQIDACRNEHNYPVEWTRLVGLVLQNAQLKLANGEPDGATELVQLHRQLRSVLDVKAAASSLGAALLPRGRQALTLAAVAWREPRQNKTALSGDIDAALADWGTIADLVTGLTAGAKQDAVARLFGSPIAGRAVIAGTPATVQRTLDLLALPLPAEGVNNVVAFLDDKHTLTEVLVAYRPKINELFPEPQNLALALIEHGYTSQAPAAKSGLNRQTWTGGGLAYDVTLLTRGNAGGALIRVAKAGVPAPAASFAHSPRDFGAVNLDRSFEQNRLEIAPDQTGPALEITDKDTLARIIQPATAFAPSAALLKREASEDLLAQLALRWPADQNTNALNRLVLPLWSAYGPARIEGMEGTDGDQLVLIWEGSDTRLKLRLPYDDKSPELLAEDSRGPAALKTRAEIAAQLNRRERQERLTAGKPRTRLARFIQLPSHGIDNLRLGMTREEAKATLPGSRSIRVQPLTDGLNILFLNEPPATAAYWPRQMFVRFGADNRLAEIRVRYQEGAHTPGKSELSLLDTLKKKPNGAPETLPATWAGLWTDLPTRKQPVFYRWLDDATSWTYQSDKGGSEVVLRDCPAEQPLGVQLPPLEFCRRGVEACVLGDTLSEVRRRWDITKPRFASNGAEVLFLPAKSPYDVLLIWYDNDKVSRLIARHRNPKTVKYEEVGAALQQAWSADLDRLGYLRRQDGPLGQVMQAYSWNDDRTRVRIFAQETEEGIRLFTEWREWPIPAKTVASK
ncbi:MAG TPA: hypothetical protein VN688_19180 [Gemmataceae bacterium]|nr:hypothetical protein [Gemmataceae bacterium]